MYEYAARLVRVVDADTYVLDIDLGMRVWMHTVRVRALGIDSPELGTVAGDLAMGYAVRWFDSHCPDRELVVHTFRDRNDNFGRLLGRVVAPDGSCLNDDLLTDGFATRY